MGDKPKFGLLKLTEVSLKPNILDAGHIEYAVRDIGPVWVNPLGVNSVRKQPAGADATVIRMDDAAEFIVKETPRTVVNRVNAALREREGLDSE